jgi:serine protease
MTTAFQHLARTLFSLMALSGLVSAQAAEVNPVRTSTVAAPSAQQARVIVKYKAAAVTATARILSAGTAGATTVPQQAKALGTRLGLSLVDGRGLGTQMQLMHASGMSSAQLAQRLAQDASVEWAVPDRHVRAFMVPNDPLFAAGQVSPNPPSGQWYLQAPDPLASPAPVNSAINAVAAWDVTLGAGQVVAVLDTGVRPDHPDLAGARLLVGTNMVSLNTSSEGAAAGKCITGNGACRPTSTSSSDPGDWVTQTEVTQYPKLFDSTCVGDSSWHGTQVSGIVGANTNNNLGVAGIASAAQILPVRVLGKCGGFDSDIIDGIRWAAGIAVTGTPTNDHPARVINLSLGGSGACGTAYQSAIDEVTAKGVVVVVAAGNDGLDVGAPGNCNGVVAVAGVRQFGTKVGYSSLGPKVTLSAPAGNCVNTSGDCLYPIVTTLNDGLTAPGNSIYSDALNSSLGTSFSAPQVAGSVALMLAARPALLTTDVIGLLKSTARAFPTTGATDGAGGGPNGSVLTCQAPSSTAQNNECYCTSTTCGAGMLDTGAAVAATSSLTAAHIVTSPSSPAAGQTLSFDGSSSLVGQGHSIASYAWKVTAGSAIVGNASAANAATYSFATTGGGTVTVQLTITDDAGTQATSGATVSVTAVTLSAAIAATPSAPAPGDAVTLSAAGSAVGTGRTITSYLWEITAGSSLASFTGATNGQTATLATTAAGTVTLKLTVTDNVGLQASTTKTLTIANASTSGGSSGGGGSGGGALSPLWALGLLLAALALPARRAQPVKARADR